jgi:hypothetical protein
MTSRAWRLVPIIRMVPRFGRQLAHELHRVVEERLRLLEVDDVDLVAMAVDVRGHLGVPEAGLVSEMDTGFQHFTHGDGHEELRRLGLESGANRHWHVCRLHLVRVAAPRHDTFRGPVRDWFAPDAAKRRHPKPRDYSTVNMMPAP